MTIHKKMIFATTALALIAATAFAHPEKSTDSEALAGADQDKRVKIIKLDNGMQISSNLELDDFGFDFDGFDMTMLKTLSGLDIESIEGEDGETRIIIKMDDSGAHKERFEKHVKQMKKHMKHAKHASKGNSRHVIKRMLRGGDDDKDVRVIVRGLQSDDSQFPHRMDLDGGMEVIIEKDGTVQVLKDGAEIQSGQYDDTSLSINKSVTNDNGKRKTRIVIEMESPE